MFGYVQANIHDLSEEEKKRYRAAYCGLCRTLGKNHGFASRLSLTYDLTFLTLLLSSLYEPTEKKGKSRCIVHPCREHEHFTNVCTDYAADMTVALTYYNCLDDWHDDHVLTKKLYADTLRSQYEKVKERWPEQCKTIEKCINELSAIEKENEADPDGAANCFGRLMESIFVYQKDRWEPQLRRLGNGLGRYIYLADAAVDLKQDIRRERYNPLTSISCNTEEFRYTLMAILGDASEAFEVLPLVQDANLLRNIIYSGLWIKFNQGIENEKKVK